MKEEQLINLPIEWKRGNGLRKSDLEDDGKFKCILYGELYTKHKNALINTKDLSRTNKTGTFYSKKGDILVPGTSTASKKDMLLAREIDEDGVILGGDINVIRPKQGLFAKKYLPYFFDTFSAYDQLDKYITGATGIIHISNTGLKKLKIPLTSYQEQQRIVSILDEAFAAIAKAKANAKKNLLNAKELFESYLQVVFENGNWDFVKLSEMATDISDGDHMPPPKSEFGLPFITISNINKQTHKIDFSNTFKVPQNYYDNLKPNKKPIKGDVLYTVTGSYGIPVLIEHDFQFCFQRHIGLIRPNKNLDSNLLYYWILSPHAISQANETATGTAQKTVSLKSLRNFSFPNIPLKEQQTIVRQLDALRAETQQLEAVYQKKIADLEELKKSILQKAFAGELTTEKEIMN